MKLSPKHRFRVSLKLTASWRSSRQSVRVLCVLQSCCSRTEGLKSTSWCSCPPDAMFSSCSGVWGGRKQKKNVHVVFAVFFFSHRLSSWFVYFLAPQMCLILNAYCKVGYQCSYPSWVNEKCFKRSSCCRIYKCIFY